MNNWFLNFLLLLWFILLLMDENPSKRNEERPQRTQSSTIMSRGMWTKHFTSDGKKCFYYNASKNMSVWNPPPDSIVHNAVNAKPPPISDQSEDSTQQMHEHISHQTDQALYSTETKAVEPVNVKVATTQQTIAPDSIGTGERCEHFFITNFPSTNHWKNIMLLNMIGQSKKGFKRLRGRNSSKMLRRDNETMMTRMMRKSGRRLLWPRVIWSRKANWKPWSPVVVMIRRSGMCDREVAIHKQIRRRSVFDFQWWLICMEKIIAQQTTTTVDQIAPYCMSPMVTPFLAQYFLSYSCSFFVSVMKTRSHDTAIMQFSWNAWNGWYKYVHFHASVNCGSRRCLCWGRRTWTWRQDAISATTIKKEILILETERKVYYWRRCGLPPCPSPPHSHPLSIGLLRRWGESISAPQWPTTAAGAQRVNRQRRAYFTTHLKSITNAVTLSVDPIINASPHNCRAQPRKFFPALASTTRATSSFRITSHTPSEASTKYSSSPVIFFSVISGSQVTYGCKLTSPIALQYKQRRRHSHSHPVSNEENKRASKTDFHSINKDTWRGGVISMDSHIVKDWGGRQWWVGFCFCTWTRPGPPALATGPSEPPCHLIPRSSSLHLPCSIVSQRMGYGQH